MQDLIFIRKLQSMIAEMIFLKHFLKHQENQMLL